MREQVVYIHQAGVWFPHPLPLLKNWSDTHGGKTIDELLSEYKELINFDDSMEKNNFKWVVQYVKKEKKKNPSYETECYQFLEDLLGVHKLYLENKNFRI